ncbi:MAG: amidohydrolase family protein [Woeseia sp.]|nr:amidohydrolase family protein [Woeseia sp.]
MTSQGRGEVESMLGYRCFLLLSVVFLSACDGAPTTLDGDILITGGRIIDPESGVVGVERDILIRSGKIHSLVEPGALVPTPGATIRDASNLYLLPGLIDVHAHIGDGGLRANNDEDRQQALHQFIRYGVTSIFVPGGGGGNDEQLGEWKRRCNQMQQVCPHIFGSGDIITAYGSHPITTIWGLPPDTDPDIIHQRGATALKESDAVEPILERKIESGVDAIKIVVEDGPGPFAPKPRLSRRQIENICNAAHDRGLRAFAHVSMAAHVDDVVEAGCDGIMHAPDDKLSDRTLQMMADQGTYYVATLSLFDALMDQEQNSREQEPYAIAGVSATALSSLENDAYWGDSAESPDSIAEWKEALAYNLLEASKKGVPIALGTDTNNPQVFPGYAVHEELALMTESGLTTAQALTSATTTAAAFLDKADSIGSIRPGYQADIVALRRNPIDTIENTRTIEFVLVGGKFVTAVVSVD